jgi:hypothetical protein
VSEVWKAVEISRTKREDGEVRVQESKSEGV